jgi:hypothetical protein
MHLRLVITDELVNTTLIYAWSDNKEQSVKISYQYHHCPGKPSLILHEGPTTCNNDFYVDFNSHVLLNQWVAKIENSEFNQPDQYRLFNHNCAIGAAFALEMAGVKLFQHDRYRMINCISLFPPVSLPLFTLTPYDVYFLAKKYKIKQADSLEVKFQEVKKSLDRVAEIPDGEKKLTQRISKEIEKQHQFHPEHIEKHIDVLMQTLHFIVHVPDKKECDQYLQSSIQFKNRIKIKNNERQFWQMIADVSFLSCLCILYMQLLRPFLHENPISGNEALMIGIPMSLTFFKARSQLSSTFRDRQAYEDTELSRNMHTLAHCRYPK